MNNREYKEFMANFKGLEEYMSVLFNTTDRVKAMYAVEKATRQDRRFLNIAAGIIGLVLILGIIGTVRFIPFIAGILFFVGVLGFFGWYSMKKHTTDNFHKKRQEINKKTSDDLINVLDTSFGIVPVVKDSFDITTMLPSGYSLQPDIGKVKVFNGQTYILCFKDQRLWVRDEKTKKLVIPHEAVKTPTPIRSTATQTIVGMLTGTKTPGTNETSKLWDSVVANIDALNKLDLSADDEHDLDRIKTGLAELSDKISTSVRTKSLPKHLPQINSILETLKTGTEQIFLNIQEKNSRELSIQQKWLEETIEGNKKVELND